MLKITVPPGEFFDEETEEFIETKGVVLELEHSLVSLSKWESHWEKSFINTADKTREETLWYIRAMTLNEVPDNVYRCLPDSAIIEINKYINSKQTATWFSSDKTPGRVNREIITAEIIYYWMVALNIPFTCENWHLERLITLIKVCDEKSSPQKKKKLNRADLNRRRELNAERLAKHGTSG